jgi:hypothetical protein
MQERMLSFRLNNEPVSVKIVPSLTLIKLLKGQNRAHRDQEGVQ